MALASCSTIGSGANVSSAKTETITIDVNSSNYENYLNVSAHMVSSTESANFGASSENPYGKRYVNIFVNNQLTMNLELNKTRALSQYTNYHMECNCTATIRFTCSYDCALNHGPYSSLVDDYTVTRGLTANYKTSKGNNCRKVCKIDADTFTYNIDIIDVSGTITLTK